MQVLTNLYRKEYMQKIRNTIIGNARGKKVLLLFILANGVYLLMLMLTIPVTTADVAAAPTAEAVVAFSDTGQSMIRSRPNSFSSPVMLPPTYQGLHNPCPMTNTRSSSANSWAWASRIASAYVSSRTNILLVIYVFKQFVFVRHR